VTCPYPDSGTASRTSCAPAPWEWESITSNNQGKSGSGLSFNAADTPLRFVSFAS